MRFRAIAAIAAAFVGSTALAGENICKLLTPSLNVDFFSKYVWRGINSNNGGVMQPTFTINYGGFSAFVFGSMEFTNWNHYVPTPNPKLKFTEYDLGLSYSRTLNKIAWTIGYLNYVYPKTGIRQTSEIYASAALPLRFNPTICVYHDVEASQGWYGNLSFSQSLPYVVRSAQKTYLPVNLSASFGFGDRSNNQYYYGDAEAAAADMLLSASCAIPGGKNITWTPSLKYSTLLSDGLNENAPRRSNLWLGLTFNYSF